MAENRVTREEKILRWIIFTVLIGVMPFGLTWLFQWGGGGAVTLASLWPHGELLLVTAAIAADAAGEVIASGRKSAKAKVLAGGGCVVIVIGCVGWFLTSKPLK